MTRALDYSHIIGGWRKSPVLLFSVVADRRVFTSVKIGGLCNLLISATVRTRSRQHPEAHYIRKNFMHIKTMVIE